jgi:IS1 family transposase
MNKLSSDSRARIIMSLVEGNSIASTCRMTGAAKMTVLSLLAEVGAACAKFHDSVVRDIEADRVQCDEVWSFCGMKQKNVPAELQETIGIGSIWTWTALDADSKLMISWLASNRSMEAANALLGDLKSRTSAKEIQISSDGLAYYIDAVSQNFAPGTASLGQVVKTYGTSSPQPGMNPQSAASRYSPGRLLSIEKTAPLGDPDMKHVSTSYMERWNLTIRMSNRRFTRLTNAFSKKFENHCHMLAITVVYYNFCRKHLSLKGQTPAMAAGLTEYRWTAADLLSLDMWSEAEAA